ncbi:transcription factor TGA7-like isoform X5 [Salvia splendens]|uniref:transcription factor TGA7-like isoform X5 n=1 Tax=Salvia splendens TaxID=180675 RepID=UPI001C256414|nr:transcription factor TGA7-like isoform X5 [Salvia splendens]
MTTLTTQFAPSSRLGSYEPMHQMSMWEEDTFDGNISPHAAAVCIINDADDKIDYTSDKSAEDSQPSRAISDKTQRRLAQNREAARKSRQRKKVYVQQLETSRLKLAQLELELERARQQGMIIAGATAHMGLCGSVSSGIAIFEVEYSHWLDQQERKIAELKNVLRTPLGDQELSVMVESVLSHYCSLFRMKRDAARADAFYLVSGMWKTSVERFFLWIGGFKPSDLINAEDALSQGMEKLQQTLAQSVTIPGPGMGNYCSQTAFALENLESLEGFINQADHLRQQTLKHMACILTTRQAANGLVAFGEYFQRLRTLSSLWSARSPGEPA